MTLLKEGRWGGVVGSATPSHERELLSKVQAKLAASGKICCLETRIVSATNGNNIGFLQRELSNVTAHETHPRSVRLDNSLESHDPRRCLSLVFVFTTAVPTKAVNSSITACQGFLPTVAESETHTCGY